MDDLAWWELVEKVCTAVAICSTIFVLVGISALAQAWAEDRENENS